MLQGAGAHVSLPNGPAKLCDPRPAHQTPIRRLHKGRGGRRGAASSGSDREEEGGEEHPVGPPIECKCETTIFEVLGLAYVPPHMRHFPSLG